MNRFLTYMAFSVFFVLINTASNAAYFARKITALRTFTITPSRNLCTAWKLERDKWVKLQSTQEKAAQIIAQRNAKNQAVTKATQSQPAHAALAELKTHIPSSDQTQSPLVARFHC